VGGPAAGARSCPSTKPPNSLQIPCCNRFCEARSIIQGPPSAPTVCMLVGVHECTGMKSMHT
jgi:hypothetical protein